MTNKASHFFCSGINFKTASINFRETLFLSQEQLPLLLPYIKQTHQLNELLILSTCNRLEIYGVAPATTNLNRCTQDIFTSICLFLKDKNNLNTINNHNWHYLKQNITAIEHLFTVVASLDSLCIGETQITGQFKKAFIAAQDSQTVSTIMSRLYQEALRVNKKIRTQTSLGKTQRSISHLAIDLAKHLFEDLTKKRFLFIGAGKMIQLAIARTKDYSPQQVFIVNRTYNTALQLANSMKIGTAYTLDRLDTLLCESDIIVSSIGAKHAIINKQMLKSVQKKRQHEPLFFIDIGVPRNIAPDCAQLEDVYLFDLDDLQKTINKQQAIKVQDMTHAQDIIKQQAQQFQHWINQRTTNPLLSELSLYLKTLFNKEKQKTLNKTIMKELSQDKQDAIHLMLQSITKKIIGDSAQYLKEEETTHSGTSLIQAFDPKTAPLKKTSQLSSHDS